MVGAFAAGTIVNPLTARSQLMGGQIWGLSAALHEATEIDRRTARYVTRDLASYHVPVHADIGRIEAILLPQPADPGRAPAESARLTVVRQEGRPLRRAAGPPSSLPGTGSGTGRPCCR